MWHFLKLVWTSNYKTKLKYNPGWIRWERIVPFGARIQWKRKQTTEEQVKT